MRDELPPDPDLGDLPDELVLADPLHVRGRDPRDGRGLRDADHEGARDRRDVAVPNPLHGDLDAVPAVTRAHQLEGIVVQRGERIELGR